MPDWVIQHVADMAEAKDQHLMNKVELLTPQNLRFMILMMTSPMPMTHASMMQVFLMLMTQPLPIRLLTSQTTNAALAANNKEEAFRTIVDVNAKHVGDDNKANEHQPFLVLDANDSNLSSGEFFTNVSSDLPPLQSDDNDTNTGPSNNSDHSYEAESNDDDLNLAITPTDIPSTNRGDDSGNLVASRSRHNTASTTNDDDNVNDDTPLS